MTEAKREPSGNRHIAFFRMGRENIEAAAHLQDTGFDTARTPPLPGQAADTDTTRFLFYRGAELLLKSFLILKGFTEHQLRGKKFGQGHDLNALLDAAIEEGLLGHCRFEERDLWAARHSGFFYGKKDTEYPVFMDVMKQVPTADHPRRFAYDLMVGLTPICWRREAPRFRREHPRIGMSPAQAKLESSEAVRRLINEGSGRRSRTDQWLGSRLWTITRLVRKQVGGIGTWVVGVNLQHPVLGELDGEVSVRVPVGSGTPVIREGDLLSVTDDPTAQASLRAAVLQFVEDIRRGEASDQGELGTP
ncbi:MAG: hypothetical protein R3F30_12515 [Planctomycetota bacterium]